jgi:hypothetical protein
MFNKTTPMKTIQTLALALLITITGSCQNKKTMKEDLIDDSFAYKPTLSCPKGYPVEVYRGWLESYSSSSSLSLGTCTGTGEWGDTGGSMSDGIKIVPDRLNLIWVSYAEDTFYHINCAIDYKKMVEKFKEGYQDSMFYFNGNGQYKHETYDYIVVGLAPGGVVVVWLSGSGKRVEIGRYKGEKIEISPQEIAKLDNHDRLMFQADYRKETMLNEKIVPLEVQKANAGKPIPYGLWDSYRPKYTWRPTVVIQREGGLFNVVMEMFNGERESLFDQTLVMNEFTKRAVPREIFIGWRDKTGQNYGGTVDFDEKEIFDAYKQLYQDNKDTEAELVLETNIPNTFITALLRANGKDIRLPKTKVDVYKSRRKR